MPGIQPGTKNLVVSEHGAYSVEGETDIRQSLINMKTPVGLRRIVKVYGRRGHLPGGGHVTG